MEASIAALIILTVVLFGVLTLTYAYISAQDTILESWREMEERLGDRARTQISSVGATTDGDTVTLTLENEGEIKLADFDQWDVIVQYDTDNDGDHDAVEWLSYNYVETIYLMSGEWGNNKGEDIGEVFEPGIFNPGEAMTITLVVSSEITHTGVAIIGTPNGITAPPAVFTR